MSKLAKDFKVGDQIPCVVVHHNLYSDNTELVNAVVDNVEHGEYITSLTVSCLEHFKNVLFHVATPETSDIESLRLTGDVLRIFSTEDVIAKISIYANGQSYNSTHHIIEPTLKRIVTFEKFIYNEDDYADNNFVELAKENGYKMVSTTVINI